MKKNTKKCCANCLRYDTCSKKHPNKALKEICTAWAGSSRGKSRYCLQKKRKEHIKTLRKSSIAKWILAIFACAFFFFAIGKVGNNDLRAELGVPDGVSIQEYLEEMEQK